MFSIRLYGIHLAFTFQYPPSITSPYVYSLWSTKMHFSSPYLYPSISMGVCVCAIIETYYLNCDLTIFLGVFIPGNIFPFGNIANPCIVSCRVSNKVDVITDSSRSAKFVQDVLDLHFFLAIGGDLFKIRRSRKINFCVCVETTPPFFEGDTLFFPL